MPELPEVETIVRQLASTLPGCRIREVTVIRGDLLRPSEDAFSRDLPGQEIQSVTRRGKNIALSLSRPQVLLVNLGMTGRLLHREQGDRDPLPAHRGLILTLSPSGALIYSDVRRFGLLRLLTPKEWSAASARLGPEPLGRRLTAAGFHSLLARSRSPIHSWLLNQKNIAGAGNIYAAEALFRGRVHPARPAKSLASQEAEALLSGLRAVLREAIEAQGTTLRDYRTARGEEGNFGRALRVYGQEGLPCPRCKTPVERIVLSNRSAFFCPHCQPEVL